MACCVVAAWLWVQLRVGLDRLRTAVTGRQRPERLNTAVAWRPEHTDPAARDRVAPADRAVLASRGN